MNAAASPMVEDAYRALSGELSRFIAARVQSAAVVDDLVQEVFLRLHAHLSGDGQVKHLRGWVYQVARYVVADHHRGRGPVEPPEPPEPEPAPTLGWSDEDRQAVVAGALKSFIDTLPPADAEALRLVELEGLSQQALAERLGLSPSGARSRVQRARARLKAQLEACCALAFDRYGGVISCEPNAGSCDCG